MSEDQTQNLTNIEPDSVAAQLTKEFREFRAFVEPWRYDTKATSGALSKRLKKPEKVQRELEALVSEPLSPVSQGRRKSRAAKIRK